MPQSHAGDVAPGWFARLGLAIARPRWALALAGDRANAGRSGSDLILALVLVVVATQLRGLATACWIGGSAGLVFAVRTLTAAVSLHFVLLVLAALLVFAFAGAKRSLGRAFDLACVAVLPLLVVQLVATVALRAAEFDGVPPVMAWFVPAVGLGWMGALVALAIRPARIGAARIPPPPGAVVRPARRLGWGLAAVAAFGVAVQAHWIADHLEFVRPMASGDEAPAFALPEIGPTGALGPTVALASTRGKITVVDFWATWCKPCLASMPRLEQLARNNPDVAVIAINLDDPAAARALFTERGYTMKLLAGDDDVSQRYGASSIPHTVFIDGAGHVREVVSGAGPDLAAIVETIRTSPGRR